MLTRRAVLRALLDYKNARITDSDLGRWAWFLRAGYFPGTGQGPRSAVQIDDEPEFEEAIVHTIGRFTELGDAVDGTIEPEELDQLARRLSTS